MRLRLSILIMFAFLIGTRSIMPVFPLTLPNAIHTMTLEAWFPTIIHVQHLVEGAIIGIAFVRADARKTAGILAFVAAAFELYKVNA